MKNTQSPARSIAKFLIFCFLTGTSTCAASQSAVSQSIRAQSNNRTFPNPVQPRSEAIDSYTDHFFYSANPKLNKRKLDASESGYIQEWNTIRSAIAPLIKSDKQVCFDSDPKESFWEFELGKNKKSYDYLTDVIFYSRNPDLKGQKLRPGNSSAKQWSAIRRQMYVSTCGI